MFTVHYYYIHDVTQVSTETYKTRQEMYAHMDDQEKHGYRARHVLVNEKK